jgi:hypothetical protein
MFRPSLSTSTVISIFLLFACESAENEQKRLVEAQTESNTQIITESNEANQKVAIAQAEAKDTIAAATKQAEQKAKEEELEADQKAAAAKEAFMKLREDYRHEQKTNLSELDRKVARLQVKAKKAAGKARVELYRKIKRIHIRREAFASDCKLLDTEVALTWHDTKARTDKDWSKLKALVDNS